MSRIQQKNGKKQMNDTKQMDVCQLIDKLDSQFYLISYDQTVDYIHDQLQKYQKKWQKQSQQNAQKNKQKQQNKLQKNHNQNSSNKANKKNKQILSKLIMIFANMASDRLLEEEYLTRVKGRFNFYDRAQIIEANKINKTKQNENQQQQFQKFLKKQKQKKKQNLIYQYKQVYQQLEKYQKLYNQYQQKYQQLKKKLKQKYQKEKKFLEQKLQQLENQKIKNKPEYVKKYQQYYKKNQDLEEQYKYEQKQNKIYQQRKRQLKHVLNQIFNDQFRKEPKALIFINSKNIEQQNCIDMKNNTFVFINQKTLRQKEDRGYGQVSQASQGHKYCKFQSQDEDKTFFDVDIEKIGNKLLPKIQGQLYQYYQYIKFVKYQDYLQNKLNSQSKQQTHHPNTAIQQHNQKYYRDHQFGPNYQSITGDDVQNYEKAYDCRWQNFTSKQMYGLISVKPRPNYIRQGSLGNCYLIAALAALAENPYRILKLFLFLNNGSVINTKFYLVKIIFRGIWMVIKVDKNLVTKNGQLAFSKQTPFNEIWVAIIQKAWAKLYMNYRSTQGGLPQEALHDLTGAPVRLYLIKTQRERPQAFLHVLRNATQKRYPMVASSNPMPKDSRQKSGIIQLHSYTLICVAQFYNKDYKLITLVKLRNPWGSAESFGEWSDYDDQSWNSVDQKTKKQLGYKRSTEDGVFFMTYEDFLNKFRTVTIAEVSDTASYVNKTINVEIKKAVAYFKISVKVDGYYWFYVDNIPERLFRQQKQPSYYKWQGFRIRKPHTCSQNIAQKGHYIKDISQKKVSTVHVLEQIISLGMTKLKTYSQYVCKISVADPQFISKFTNDSRLKIEQKEKIYQSIKNQQNSSKNHSTKINKYMDIYKAQPNYKPVGQYYGYLDDDIKAIPDWNNFENYKWKNRQKFEVQAPIYTRTTRSQKKYKGLPESFKYKR